MTDILTVLSSNKVAFNKTDKNYTGPEIDSCADKKLPKKQAQSAYDWSDEVFVRKFVQPVLNLRMKHPDKNTRVSWCRSFLNY